MNKREKEVIKVQLKQEKQVLRQLERQYEAALTSVNEQIAMLQAKEQTTSRQNRIAYQNMVKEQLEATISKLHSETYQTIEKFMNDCYTTGYAGTMYDLHGQGMPVIVPINKNAAVKAVMTDTKLKAGVYKELGYDMTKLKKSISSELTRGVASGMAYDDIARLIKNATGLPLSRAKAIVRTEGHRIQQSSQEDARQAAKSKGADVVKQWDSTLDGKTRDSHRKLDGQIREVDEPFEINGKKAMYPGEFGDPAEDCNCRCVALTRARAALDEDELETLKKRAEYFKLDKTKDFEEFKQQYIEKSNYMPLDETVKITKKKGAKIYSSVNAELVNSKKYHDKFESLARHKPVNESIYQEAMRMLEHRDGTPHEDMVLIDSRTGKFVTGNMDSSLVGKTGLTAEQYAAAEKHKGKLTIVHNHPNSSRISYTDILTMYRNPNIDSIVAVGHDGSVQIVSDLNREVDIEKLWHQVYNDVVESTKDRTLAEHAATTFLYDSKIFKTESR